MSAFGPEGDGADAARDAPGDRADRDARGRRARGHRRRCSCSSASTSASPRCRSSPSASSPASPPPPARSASSRRPEAIKPDFKKINPASGLKNLFNPQHLAVETRQERRQGRDRGRDRRARAVPQARRAGGAGGHAAGRPDPPDRGHRDDDRAARGGRLPRDRGRRLRLAALPAREAAADGPRGDQAGVQAAGPSCRNQVCTATPGDGTLPRAHDGCRSLRRRDRHQPDPLLRRAEVRERECRTHRRRQGRRQPCVQDP